MAIDSNDVRRFFNEAYNIENIEEEIECHKCFKQISIDDNGVICENMHKLGLMDFLIFHAYARNLDTSFSDITFYIPPLQAKSVQRQNQIYVDSQIVYVNLESLKG